MCVAIQCKYIESLSCVTWSPFPRFRSPTKLHSDGLGVQACLKNVEHSGRPKFIGLFAGSMQLTKAAMLTTLDFAIQVN
jgi:hypothetical protein